jgi:hypothetical protein
MYEYIDSVSTIEHFLNFYLKKHNTIAHKQISYTIGFK